MAKKVVKKSAKKSAKKAMKKAVKPAAKKAVRKLAKKVTKARPAAIKKVAPKKVAPKTAASKAVGATGGAAVVSRLPALGSLAPAFTLVGSGGAPVSLTQFQGKTVVMFFYPKADTPGCTKEACGFRDTSSAFAAKGAVVLGVSPDPEAAVTKFATKFTLGYLLLADADHAVCERYGVWVEKSMYGKKYMGAARTTFIIDPAGRVAKVFEKVNPDGHEQEVLAALA